MGEDAKAKLAPFSALNGDESYQNRDLEKVFANLYKFIDFETVCGWTPWLYCLSHLCFFFSRDHIDSHSFIYLY